MGYRALIFCPLLIAGCATTGGADDPIHGVTPEGVPAWVNRGSGAYDGAHGKAFYGVGVLQGVDNPGLARQAVDNRARAEIAKIFDTYVAAMMQDYQRSTTAGDFSASAEEQDIVSAQKTVTEVTLRGVEVRDHWADPRTGTLYALAILDLNAIGDAMNNANQLSSALRDHVRENARRAFEDLDRELQQRSDRAEPQAAPAPEADAEAEAEVAPEAAPEPAAAPARQENPRVGLKIQGTGAQKIQTCFAEQLTGRGLRVFEGTSDVDVMVHGQLKYKKAGEVSGSVMVRADIDLRVNDLSSGQTLAAFSDNVKVGRGALEQSVQLAIFRLCTQVAPKLVQQIQPALGQ